MDTHIYQQQLEAEATTLKIQLEQLGVQNNATVTDWIPTPHAVADSSADENVVADRSEDWAETRGTLDALETRYNNINRALKKIADGTYGICEISGEPIEADRLAANPAARTCKAHLDAESTLPLA